MGEVARVAAGLIDGTIWRRREAGSLMSLRIDEDKMGLGSRGNNFRGSMLLLMGHVPARPASDGRFPHLPPSSCTSPLQLKWEKGGASCLCKERNSWVQVWGKGNQLQHCKQTPSAICLHDLNFILDAVTSELPRNWCHLLLVLTVWLTGCRLLVWNNIKAVNIEFYAIWVLQFPKFLCPLKPSNTTELATFMLQTASKPNSNLRDISQNRKKAY